MADIWQIIIQSNTFNFIIVLAVLLFIMSKLNMAEKIDNLRNDIKSYIEESSAEKQTAKDKLDEINKKIEHLPEELEDIKSSAESNIQGMVKRIELEIEDKKKDIENNANRILDLEIKNFKSKLSAVLSEASVNLSRKNAAEQLQNNRELHDKYIYEAIEEIDKVNL